jgi:hypothetical protein
LRTVAKPTRFEDQRYLGDKRTQRVYDLDLVDVDAAVAAAVDDVMAAESFLAFSPDTLAEARNRGYRPDRAARAAAEPQP